MGLGVLGVVVEDGREEGERGKGKRVGEKGKRTLNSLTPFLIVDPIEFPFCPALIISFILIFSAPFEVIALSFVIFRSTSSRHLLTLSILAVCWNRDLVMGIG